MISPQVGLEGRVNWYLLDSKTKKVLRKGRQKNLLVTGMKDSLHQLSVVSTTGQPSYYQQRNQLVVGDNAAAPAVTDTALVNQIGASTSFGTFLGNGPEAGTKDTTNNRLKWSTMIRRVYPFPSTQNVREIGFKDMNSLLTVRFLPLDGSNNPTTITGNAGQELLVEHTLEVSVAWPVSVPTASFNIGATAYNVEYTFFANTAANVEQVIRLLIGTLAASVFIGKVAMSALTRDPASFSGGNFDTYSSRLTVQPYSVGSGQRVRSGVIGTGESNTTWHGALFASTAYGLAVRFLSPATYVKTSSVQVTIPIRGEVTLNATA
jgi:hypothetical protein